MYPKSKEALGCLIIAGVLFLFLGTIGLYTAIRNWSPTVMDCSQYLKEGSSASWLRLTGCKIDYREACLKYKTSDDFFVVPVRGKDTNPLRPIKILLDPDWEMLRLIRAYHHLKKAQKVAREAFIKEHYHRLVVASGTIEGWIDNTLDEKRREYLKQNLTLAHDYILIEEGEESKFGISLFLFLLGITCLFPGWIKACVNYIKLLSQYPFVDKFIVRPIYWLFLGCGFIGGNIFLLYCVLSACIFVPLFYNIHFNPQYENFWEDTHNYVTKDKVKWLTFGERIFELRILHPDQAKQLEKERELQFEKMKKYRKKYNIPLLAEETGFSLPANKMNEIVILDHFLNHANPIYLVAFLFPLLYWTMRVWFRFFAYLTMSGEAKQLCTDYLQPMSRDTLVNILLPAMFVTYIIVLFRCWSDPIAVRMGVFFLSMVTFALTYTSAFWFVFLRYIIDFIFIHCKVDPRTSFSDDIIVFVIGLPLLLFFDNSWQTILGDLSAGVLPFLLMKTELME
ncbi:hypothetical protein [Candidatus Uabimicrobium amorphum]|uniref:Uncharacterized protein n=1 Tax=Uabimicrobium amorphum TaxID=2596890 RepID=A0A5S9IIJ8_UABAM|nr:hypothetical protein [Candidatus Uabimicrobium amorphum]BBM82314.1 hypothetical protein UABAM_00657 [Candidatus Uabimicrobium amorphum]